LVDEYEATLNQLCYSFWDRINRQNKNWIAFMAGETGGGKSWGSMEIARRIDKKFWPTTHMTWTAMEFMELIDSGRLHKGNMIISDETGTSLPKREWYSIFNKKINYVLQTFRHENIGVIMIAPTLEDFVDSQTQKLLQFYLEVTKINLTERYAIVKVRNIDVNRITGKLYFKRPHVTINEKDYRLRTIRVPAPPKEMTDAYEPIAAQKKKELKHTSYQELIEHEEKAHEVKEDRMTVINRITKEATARGMVNPTPYELMAEFGCSEHFARVIKHLITKAARPPNPSV
jgi:ABC-type dipeptide/oligopeptide/nickel transport system ATPase component